MARRVWSLDLFAATCSALRRNREAKSIPRHAAPSKPALVFAEVEAIIDAVEEFKQFRIKATRFWKRMEVGAGPGKGTVYAVLSGEKEAAHGLAPIAVDL